MTRNAWTWVVAVWELGTAAGIASFWLTWFRKPHEEAWQPPGYVEHERVFVFPDSVLATLLAVSAILQLGERPLGGSLALVASGMLAFLGIIDAAYFTQHRMFAREREGLANAGIVVSVLSLAVVLAVRYH